jgi:hypothetical protein
MKQLSKAILLGGAIGGTLVSANASALTSTDVWLFISGTSNFYAADLGITEQSLLLGSSIPGLETAHGGPVNDTTHLSAPSLAVLNAAPNLSAFIAANCSAPTACKWSIQSGTAAAGLSSGDEQLLVTGGLNAPTTFFNNANGTGNSGITSALSTSTAAYNGFMNTTLNAATFTNNSTPIGSGALPVLYKSSWISTLFPDQTALGNTQFLYEMASSNGTSVNAFEATSSITLSTNGTFTETSLVSNVPLPAAAWLLGSGLLGLLGVGRRRRVA